MLSCCIKRKSWHVELLRNINYTVTHVTDCLVFKHKNGFHASTHLHVNGQCGDTGRSFKHNSLIIGLSLTYWSHEVFCCVVFNIKSNLCAFDGEVMSDGRSQPLAANVCIKSTKYRFFVHERYCNHGWVWLPPGMMICTFLWFAQSWSLSSQSSCQFFSFYYS